uniref:ATP synthase subunit a n=1 Tax=Psolodesmus mandarinus TaxID=193280 RepID=A0A4P2SLX4_9ODON|nr:ATP synthase F0 subunit 6 [Psolodesmus mandarinus]AWH61861.1 ATP synthase F0 subunit 6 [Psolodesmus mandarinus]
MMTNLFSVFDPTSSIFKTPANWSSTLISVLMLPTMYWLIPSRYSSMWNKITSTLHKEFKTLLGSGGMNGSTIMFISVFSTIVFINFMGLFPYLFTSTSHLVFTLTMALPLWMCYMIYGWLNHTQHMLAHLVPQGTPPALMPFMVCIETISNMIRPGTLAVRLAANMIAGHLLLTLMGSTGPSLTYMMTTLLLFTQVALLMLESAVAIIQSYVFAVLSTLYSSEVN